LGSPLPIGIDGKWLMVAGCYYLDGRLDRQGVGNEIGGSSSISKHLTVMERDA